MMSENRSFLIRGEDGQEYGPVDLSELREWVQENRAGLGTSVRLDQPNSSWLPWQNFPELVALVAEVQGLTPFAGTMPAEMVFAPIWRRVTAWILDVLLLSFLFVPIMSVLEVFLPVDVIAQAMMNPASLQDLPPQILHQVMAFEIVANACLILYLAGFSAAHGKTPGKAIMRIRIIDQNGQNPSLPKALLRALALICSINLFFIPLFYAFFNPQKRTFHDIVAGTCVIEA
jgi:uncharacterized RDD family membrane protein YckC